jgi:hypothetical protein
MLFSHGTPEECLAFVCNLKWIFVGHNITQGAGKYDFQAKTISYPKIQDLSLKLEGFSMPHL